MRSRLGQLWAFFLPTGVGPSASLSNLVSTAEATWSNGNRSYQNKSTVKLIVVVLTFKLNWWINLFILLHSEPNTTGQGQVKGRLNVRLKMLIQCFFYFIAWLAAFALFLYSKLVCWNVLQTERSGCRRKTSYVSNRPKNTDTPIVYSALSISWFSFRSLSTLPILFFLFPSCESFTVLRYFTVDIFLTLQYFHYFRETFGKHFLTKKITI